MPKYKRINKCSLLQFPVVPLAVRASVLVHIDLTVVLRELVRNRLYQTIR